MSALMALKGASITLIDYSQIALNKAKALFQNIGVNANFMKGNILDMPGDLLNSFDISMSFGLVEHFNYPLRRETIYEFYRFRFERKCSKSNYCPRFY